MDTQPPLIKEKPGRDPEIEIVIPVFKNADTVEELYGRLKTTLKTVTASWGILFVDDGCPHDSLVVLTMLASKDDRVSVVALSANVGQHRAVMVGLSYSRAKIVVIMDADLQDPPGSIPVIVAELKRGPDKAVFAGRAGAYESPFRLFTSRLFKRVLHVLTGVPKDAGLFVAMDREMVDRVLRFGAPHPFVVALIGLTQLPCRSIPVTRKPRPHGNSAYSSWRRLITTCRVLHFVIFYRLNLATDSSKPTRPEIKAIYGPASGLRVDS